MTESGGGGLEGLDEGSGGLGFEWCWMVAVGEVGANREGGMGMGGDWIAVTAPTGLTVWTDESVQSVQEKVV